MMGHKPGCIWSDAETERLNGVFHRTPIDCCTVEDLQKEIKRQTERIEALEKEAVKLKAEIYDLEREERY